MMDRGMIERALNKDAPVCGTPIASAYDKPRSLWVMHHAVRDTAVVALGEQETTLTMDQILERLRSRCGNRVGDPRA
jgi:hypothetical protein